MISFYKTIIKYQKVGISEACSETFFRFHSIFSYLTNIKKRISRIMRNVKTISPYTLKILVNQTFFTLIFFTNFCMGVKLKYDDP